MGTVHLQSFLTLSVCVSRSLSPPCFSSLHSPRRFFACICHHLHTQLSPGSHSTEEAVNKQLNDKERVLAALENPALLEMVNRCLAGSAANGDTAPLTG